MTQTLIAGNARIRSEAIRNRRYVVITFGLCIGTLFLSGLLSRTIPSSFSKSPIVVGLISATLLAYGYAALRRPEGRTTDSLWAMNFGLKWGAAVGCIWLIGLTGEPAVWFLGMLLPILCGAVGGVTTGKLRSGTFTGIWCGLASGLLGFLVFAMESNLGNLFPAMFPHVDPEALVPAFFVLIVYGPVFCPVAGTIGALIAIPLERTGRAPASLSHSA